MISKIQKASNNILRHPKADVAITAETKPCSESYGQTEVDDPKSKDKKAKKSAR